MVVVEQAGPTLPSGIDFNKLVCDSGSKRPKLVDPLQNYSQSYPLVAHSIFNWGRARGYLAAGGLFSFDNNNFSEESIFMGLNMTKNWLWGGPFRTYPESGQNELGQPTTGTGD